MIALADLAIFSVVAFFVVAVPLLVAGLIPIPAKEKEAFLAGFILGGLFSLMLKKKTYS